MYVSTGRSEDEAKKEAESSAEQEVVPARSEGEEEELQDAVDAWRLASVVPCYRPLHGFRKPGGGLAFTRNEGWVDRPVSVSCGQCIGCRIERSRQWALRCVHESKFHEDNSYITLTYSDENLPEDLSVDVREWQLFAKRMRKEIGPFRFFHCGEYGEKLRPHYHACVFGYGFRKDRVFRTWNKQGDPLFSSKELAELWQDRGHVWVGELTWQSAAYVARYVIDKVNGERAERRYSRYDPESGRVWKVKPEYVTMSRRPGLGSKWFEKYKGDVYPGDFVVHDGRKFRPPSFYDQRLSEEELASMKAKRIEKARKYAGEQTADRLVAREKHAVAQMRNLDKNR